MHMQKPTKKYWSEKSWKSGRGFNELSGVTYNFQDSESVRVYERYNGQSLPDSERYKDIPEKHREWFSDMITRYDKHTNTYIYVDANEAK